MKIFVAGVATETNTFSPIPTGMDDFVRADVDGEEASHLFSTLPFFREYCAAGQHELVVGTMAFAQPAGLTARPVYESLRDEILAQLRSGAPIEVVFLMLHGAMVAEGYEDCEADLIRRVRDIVGPDVAIGVELDLHAHVDARMLEPADIVVAYKEYPHVDVLDRAREILDLCVATRRGEVRPVCAVFDCRMVGVYTTTQEPMHGFVQRMHEAEEQPGVLSVSFIHGFPWGDVPHAGGKMLAIADGNRELAAGVAEQLGRDVFAQRHQVSISSLPLEAALEKALASDERPVVVADQSDNAGGGAPADSTFALRWLLEHGARSVGTAILYDPEVVKIARAAGEGAVLPVRLGGKTGQASGDPLDLTVRVLGLRANYLHEFPQASGKPLAIPLGDVAALECEGIYIIVGSRRSQCFSHKIFRDFGLDDLDIYIPKSTNHFMSGFGPIAREVIYMAAPGAIVPDMRQIDYRAMPTDKFPWVDDPFQGPARTGTTA